ncbi:MAG: type II toxin-antitoxin system RelE/ParE family toxin [Bacteroidota bacterium]
MSASFSMTKLAVKDLEDIWHFTAENWSIVQVDRYYQSLITEIRFLANNPGLGKSYADLLKNCFGFAVGSHIVFYKKCDPEGILIVRIIHQRMDLSGRLFN